MNMYNLNTKTKVKHNNMIKIIMSNKVNSILIVKVDN